jgi:hypothetical protein
MKRPPLDTRLSVGYALVVVLTSILVLTAAQATVAHPSAASERDVCEDDSYSPPPLEESWEQSYTDSLDSGSLGDWSEGEIVRVGSSGSCSLLVTDGNSAQLEATTVDGTRGVATGTVDLGANGSLNFAANGSETAASANERSEIVVSNPGPDYGTTVVIETGPQSENVTLSSGRFFEFALRQDNRTTRIAVWDLDNQWDGEWDLTVENVTSDEDLTIGLDGEAFLDGVSVGVVEPDQPKTTTETTSDDDSADVDDPFEPGDGRDWDERNTDPGREQDSSGRLFGGVLLVVGGAVVFRYARPLTRFSEQIDAIGSTTDPEDVEPAGWNVFLTKATAVFFALLGLYLGGTAIL